MKSRKRKLLYFLLLLFISTLTISLSLKKDNKRQTNTINKMSFNEDIELDNWELSTVFYDSTVGNGKTPLTEINWDASDGGYGNGEQRIITVQINYKNSNTIKEYNSGDVIIRIPNILKNNEDLFNYTRTVGANYGSSTGFDWSIDTLNDEYLEFKNVYAFEKNINFEGSIRIEYKLTPKVVNPIKFEEVIKKELNKEVIATINNTIESNTIIFKYRRDYYYNWQLASYSINKMASELTNIDYIDNPDDYYWVKYTIIVIVNPPNPNITSTNIYADKIIVQDELPNDVIVLDINNNTINIDNNLFTFENGLTTNTNYIYFTVGYPKASYDTNHIISNEAKLYAKYENSENLNYVNSSIVSIDLFNYNYKLGDKYNLFKTPSAARTHSNKVSYSYDNYLYYENLKGNTDIGCKANIFTKIDSNIVYSGTKYDLKIVDDFLYITDENNQYRILNDNEYYFNNIAFPIALYDGNKKLIPKNTIDISLYVRKRGETNYELVENFKNTTKADEQKVWQFTEDDGIVSFYFIIYNIKHSILFDNDYTTSSPEYISSYFKIKNLDNVHENIGSIMNYAYYEVISENGILNIATDSDYTSNLNITNIKNKDLEVYGSLKKRYAASIPYSKYEIRKPTQKLETGIETFYSTKHQETEMYTGTFTFNMKYENVSNPYNEYEYDNLHTLLDREFWNDGYELYNLLPKGMQISSSKEEIKESIKIPNSYLCDKKTKSGYIINKYDVNYFKERTNVYIIQNWQNTGRTMLKIIIDFSEDPVLFFKNKNYPYTGGEKISFSYKWYIDFDSVMTYGNKYTNSIRVKYLNRTTYSNNDYSYGSSTKLDDGKKSDGTIDPDEIDINKNNNINEALSMASSTVTLDSTFSTHQDVQVSIQTDQSNYNTGIVNTSNNTEYTYKLRVRTGANDVTNLVIYDSLEDYAKNPDQELVKAAGTRNYWQGEFLDVDTTYAESKGYTVKTYYSEEIKPGSLTEDDSWHEYNDTVDKSKIKSFAFEYLDSEGNPAVLPTNSLTYVLIKMRSPSEELKTFAYNGCWTEWNAIDPLTNEPVDFITGINSNIVRVGLPNSVVSEEADYTIEKIWNDNNNLLNVRPDSIKVKVIPDGDISRAMEVVLTNEDVNILSSNIWSKTIELDKYDENGNEINYTYSEDDIELSNYVYNASVNNNIVTNNLSQKFTITKNWIDNNNEYLTRPTNTTIKVYQNDTYLQDITITGDYSTNEWTKEVYLPAIDNQGNRYNYTFEETNINHYETSYDVNTYTFTNTLKENKNINIKKIWHDNNNEYNTRPDSLKVYLKQNNNNYKEITLTGDTSEWLSEEITIPIYDDEGVKYTYSIEEDDINEDYTIIEYDQTNFEISNKLNKNINLTITKNWKDGSNSYDTRPDSLKINLLQNNNNYQEITLTGDSDIWTYNIEVPKYDDNQVLYKYSIEEDLDNTEYKIEYNENGTEVTNILDGTKSITITKIWIDEDNKYNTRPDKVLVNLLRNNELYKEVEIKAEEEWKTTMDNLPIYDSNGYKYVYTIEEKETLERYTNINYNQDTYTITNELTDIPKVTLYFTLKNGYTINNGDLLYDEEGLNNVLSSYNLDNTYKHKLTIRNVETKDIYTGEINTLGILEFKDIPYGTYETIEEDDEYFNFVSMLEIDKVEGIEYTSNTNGGRFTIKPTGKNIIYGLNIINKIPYILENKIDNPNTKEGIIIVVIVSLISIIGIIILNKIKIKKIIQ